LPTIAFVANSSWSMYNFRRGLLRELRSRGYRIVVIAPQDNFSAALIADGMDFIPLEMDNYGSRLLTELATLRQLRRIYRECTPDLIFHYTIKPNIYGTIAAASIGIPSVAVITGLGHTFSNHKLAPIVKLLYRYALRKSKSVWFLNNDDKRVFEKLGIGNSVEQKVLPGEGVDTTWFYESKTPQTEPLVFLYAGRMLFDKGVGDFAEAAAIVKARFPETSFRMVGFIDQRNPGSVSSRQLLEWRNSGNLEYLGETTDIRPFIDAAHCVVLPSYYGEGLSRILLEACSMAKPIITTRNVGCAQLVEEGINGYLCNVRDPRDLAHQMEKMIADGSEKRTSMGQRSRQIVKSRYEEQVIVDIYLEFIRKHLPGR